MLCGLQPGFSMEDERSAATLLSVCNQKAHRVILSFEGELHRSVVCLRFGCKERLRFKAMTRDVLDGQNKAKANDEQDQLHLVSHVLRCRPRDPIMPHSPTHLAAQPYVPSSYGPRQRLCLLFCGLSRVPCLSQATDTQHCIIQCSS